MKRNIRRIVALCLVAVMVSAMSVNVFAASYYVNHYTNGKTSHSFQITAKGIVSHWSMETQDFPSGSEIIAEVWNENGSKQISSFHISITGNGKKENRAFVFPLLHPAGTYTIKYNVHYGGSGWIGVWLY